MGWGLVLAGGAAALWGGISLLSGAKARLTLGPDTSMSDVSVGLAGAIVLTLGLIWVRD
jgi:hypothetical protein